VTLRFSISLLCVAGALLASGCGGGSETTAPEAFIPSAVAEDLATKSDAVADALDAENVCDAAKRADELKDAVDAAVAGGEVPSVFRDELERTATDLQNQVNCEKKDEEHGKGKKKGQDKDETTTLGTTSGDTTTVEEG
jgi:hypothetical protein